MKKLFLAFATLLLTYACSAQKSTKDIVNNFFQLYSKDPYKALDYAFSTNLYFEKKADELSVVKGKFRNLIELLGQYDGYELLSEKTAGQSITMSSYLVKYDRQPIRFTFYFYKPQDIWRVNNFTFDEDIDDELKEATKVYRLKENLGF